jgi:hypothetical protein
MKIVIGFNEGVASTVLSAYQIEGGGELRSRFSAPTDRGIPASPQKDRL